MKLERFESQGLELVINTETGEVFANQNALARMCSVDSSTIRRWKDSLNIPTLSTQILTGGGLQGVALYDEDAIFGAIKRYKPELFEVCARAGIRLYLHQLAGFRFVSVQSDSAMLAKILAIVEDQQVRIANLERISAEAVSELKGVRVVLDQLEGLDEIMKLLKQSMVNDPHQPSFTLSSILRLFGFRNLTRGQHSQIGRQISDWVKLHSLQPIEKKNGKTLYKKCFAPLIVFAAKQTLLR